MKASTRYRLLQGAFKAWLAVARHSVRVLGVERPPKSAAILYLSHYRSLLDPLIVATACGRTVASVIDGKPSSRLRSLASTLNIIFSGPDPQALHSSLRTCTEVFVSGGTVLVLETPEPGQPRSARTNTAFILACEAWASAFPGEPPVVLPIELFYTSVRDQDILVHIGGKLSLEDQTDGHVDDLTPHSSPTFQRACRNRVFAFDDGILEDLLGDLEHALQTRLYEQWQARPAWKQSVRGLRLSSCAAASLCKINEQEPETLVALRDLCESDHETHRQWSLACLRSMLEGGKLSPFTRFVGWTESIVGLPLALYGLLNHLVAALLLYLCGLTGGRQSSKGEPWLARILAVVSCYGGQIALANGVAGRAAAGYYALTLPTSGLYLFRYWWLLRKRTRVLLLKKRAASLHRLGMATRKRFFESLDQLFDRGIKRSSRDAHVGT